MIDSYHNTVTSLEGSTVHVVVLVLNNTKRLYGLDRTNFVVINIWDLSNGLMLQQPIYLGNFFKNIFYDDNADLV